MKRRLLVLCAALTLGSVLGAHVVFAQVDPTTPFNQLTSQEVFSLVLGARDSTGAVIRALTNAEIDTAMVALGFHQGLVDTNGAPRAATWDEFQREVLSRVSGPIRSWIENYEASKIIFVAPSWGE